jgi:hypothetical protein
VCDRYQRHAGTARMVELVRDVGGVVTASKSLLSPGLVRWKWHRRRYRCIALIQSRLPCDGYRWVVHNASHTVILEIVLLTILVD